jgi:hypothetical protein
MEARFTRWGREEDCSMDGWVVLITGTTNTVAARLMKVATTVLLTH